MEEVLAFSSQVGLPITLADIGMASVARERLSPIAVRATAPGETSHNEPFEVTPETVTDAILAADAIGRGWRKQHGCDRS
jgi:glycerol dehydrogenase